MKIWMLPVLLLGIIYPLYAIDLEKEIDLEEVDWRFEIGDNMDYKNLEYNDSQWELIEVSEPWENEGFPGYDGYAWYRLTFKISAKLRDKKLYLKLGKIDGVDMTYFNGQLLGGHGSFPPDYKSAHDVKRVYPLPADIVQFNKNNVIAVRVYDLKGEGGIVDGDVGIYSRKDDVKFEIDLEGYWKFKPGDDLKWADPKLNDMDWKHVNVPNKWEHQGFDDYDGFAWYRKTVTISHDLYKNKLILMLGKINDVDEVYFNGRLIGRMGSFPNKNDEDDFESACKKERAYFIPPDSIIPDKQNGIAVRVYDVGGSGGIYDGYIGIITRREYLKYKDDNND